MRGDARRFRARSWLSGALVLVCGGCPADGRSSVAPELPTSAAAEASEPAIDDEAARLWQSGDGEQALEAYLVLLAAHETEELAGTVFTIAIETGRVPQAIERITAIIDADRAHVRGSRLALALLKTHEYRTEGHADAFEVARKQLQNVLAVKTENPLGLSLAVLLHGSTPADSPYREYARQVCVDAEAQAPLITATCADFSLDEGDPRRANQLYESAVERQPDLHAAWLNWGLAALEVGDLDQVIVRCSRAVEARSGQVRYEAQMALGVARRQQGELDASEVHLRAAAEAAHPGGLVVAELPTELLYNLGTVVDATGSEPELAASLLGEYLARVEAAERDRPTEIRMLRARAALHGLGVDRAQPGEP